MMDKLLTKEEIEALLIAVSEGRVDPDKELSRDRGGVVNYDLFNTTAHKGLMPNLDIVYDSFIRYHRVSMSNRLRKIVEIKKIGARPYKFDDFLKTLPSPVCMGIFKIDPLKGASVVTMDNNLVYAVIDSVLGGSGSPSIMENNRLYTSIELKIMQKIMKDALLDMEKSWVHLQSDAKMNLLRLEMNPRLVNIVPPEYLVVTMELEIQIENTRGSMVFAIPYMTVDPIKEKLKYGGQIDTETRDPKWTYKLSTELCDAPMAINVEMGHATITLRELLHLECGDTIMLDKDVQSPMVMKVGGIGKFLGNPGVYRGNKALQILRNITREEAV
jgi:flagellar motor switch protein FliM